MDSSCKLLRYKCMYCTYVKNEANRFILNCKKCRNIIGIIASKEDLLVHNNV